MDSDNQSYMSPRMGPNNAAIRANQDQAAPARNQPQFPEAWASLRSSEIRYRRLFEAARDGILILDAASRKITDANPFMSELLGYSHQELIGKELWEIGLL